MVLFDLPVYQFLIDTFGLSNAMIFIMKVITTLGSTIVILTGIFCVFVLFKNKIYFKNFALANLIGVILNNLIKIIVKRPRPTNTLFLTSETSYSFPSGHTMMSTIFYGLIIYYLCKNLKSQKIKYPLIGLISLTIFFIGISRVYLGVHYATDVLSAHIVGIVYLIIYIKISNKITKKEK